MTAENPNTFMRLNDIDFGDLVTEVGVEAILEKISQAVEARIDAASASNDDDEARLQADLKQVIDEAIERIADVRRDFQLI